MKLIDKLTEGKNFKFILLICCVLSTAAFIFNTIDSRFRREKIVSELDSVRRELGYLEYINRELGSIGSELWSIRGNLGDIGSIGGGLSGIEDKLGNIEWQLRFRR